MLTVKPGRCINTLWFGYMLDIGTYLWNMLDISLVWPDCFIPFFFGVAKKGSGLVYG